MLSWFIMMLAAHVAGAILRPMYERKLRKLLGS